MVEGYQNHEIAPQASMCAQIKQKLASERPKAFLPVSGSCFDRDIGADVILVLRVT